LLSERIAAIIVDRTRFFNFNQGRFNGGAVGVRIVG
jgi:hypothetical protein